MLFLQEVTAVLSDKVILAKKKKKKKQGGILKKEGVTSN